MNTKKLLLTGLSVFCLGAAAIAQESRVHTEHRDGMDEADEPVHVHLKKTATLYSRDLISIMPFQYTENGIGTGLSWEHTLDHDGYLAFYLPVIATFNLNKPSRYYADNSNNDALFYAMPGIKFYPTGLGKVKYAIGPSAVVAVGQESVDYGYYYPLYSSYVPTYENKSHFLFGMMINNSLNLNPTPRLHVGLEMGFGFTYIDRIGGINQGVSFLTQGNFSIGYRF